MTVPADPKQYAEWLKETKALPLQEKRKIALQDFAMSTRAHSVVTHNRLVTIGDLLDVSESQFLRLRHCGVATRYEFSKILESVGLRLLTDSELRNELKRLRRAAGEE